MTSNRKSTFAQTTTGIDDSAKLFAEILAEDAHESRFLIRWGVWRFRGSDTICLFDNDPNTSFPNLADQELAQFRAG